MTSFLYFSKFDLLSIIYARFWSEMWESPFFTVSNPRLSGLDSVTAKLWDKVGVNVAALWQSSHTLVRLNVCLYGIRTGPTSSFSLATPWWGLLGGHHSVEELSLPHRTTNDPFGLPVPSATPVSTTCFSRKGKMLHKEQFHRSIWDGKKSFLSQ